MTRPTRVLHCLCRVASGGVEQRLPLMLDFLPQGEFIHEVICQDTSGELAVRLRARGVAIHEIGAAPSLLDPRWYLRALPIARRFKPDILHGGVIEGNALANVLGLAMPNVKVISEETSHPLTRKARTEIFLRTIFRRSDAVIGVSSAVCDYLRERLAVSEDKLVHIDNGVTPAPVVSARERAVMRAELGLSDTDMVVGSVGRMEDEHKRFSDLIRAMTILRDPFPGARLLIIGDGPDRSRLEELAATLGLGSAVIFAGYRGNPRPYYALMDVFALVSATEAFGLVLVEAMLAGVPVIGTRVGGIPHVLDEGRAGMLVTPCAPEELAATLGRLLGDHTARKRLGEAGRSHASSHFSAERYAADITALYRRLIDD